MDFVKGIAQAIAQAAELEVSDIETAVEIPADTKMGDYAFPCFRLAKTLRKAPPLIAQDIVSKLVKPDFVSDIQVVGAEQDFCKMLSVLPIPLPPEVAKVTTVLPEKS